MNITFNVIQVETEKTLVEKERDNYLMNVIY